MDDPNILLNIIKMHAPAFQGTDEAQRERKRAAVVPGGEPWDAQHLEPSVLQAVHACYGKIAREGQNEAIKLIKQGGNLLLTSNSDGGVSTACKIAGVDHLVRDTTITEGDEAPRVVSVGDTHEVAQSYMADQDELLQRAGFGETHQVALFHGNLHQWGGEHDTRLRPASAVGVAATPGDLFGRVTRKENDWSKVRLVIIERAHMLAQANFRQQLLKGICAITKISEEAGNTVQVVMNTHELRLSDDMQWMIKKFLGEVTDYTTFRFGNGKQFVQVEESFRPRQGKPDTEVAVTHIYKWLAEQAAAKSTDRRLLVTTATTTSADEVRSSCVAAAIKGGTLSKEDAERQFGIQHGRNEVGYNSQYRSVQGLNDFDHPDKNTWVLIASPFPGGIGYEQTAATDIYVHGIPKSGREDELVRYLQLRACTRRDGSTGKVVVSLPRGDMLAKQLRGWYADNSIAEPPSLKEILD